MNSNPSDNEPAPTRLEERSRELLAASAAALSGRVQSRLTAARFAATAEVTKQAGAPRFRVPGVWLPGGALAAAAVLAVAVWIAQPTGNPGAVLAEASAVEDAEMLASNDEPELYADDPDFYEWAGAEPPAGAG
jgi:hypothetical protein